MKGVSLLEPASFENFNELAYLLANPDVAHAIRTGGMPSGEHHFKGIGYTENRDVARLDLIRTVKAHKIRRVKDELLLPDQPFTDHLCGAINCLTPEMADDADLNPVSSHAYESHNQRVVDENPNKWILDAGAGFRPMYYENVVNLELAPFVTTDVIGIAERLPFRPACFDFVFSNAVLEHVKDPFAAAKEIVRVLKPGGMALVQAPFLVPYHGYPHHYFNMTRDGLQTLFADLEPIDHFVPWYQHPVWMVKWVLSSWSSALAPETRLRFERLTVAELIAFGREKKMAEDFVATLPNEKQFELAQGTFLIARKPNPADASGHRITDSSPQTLMSGDRAATNQ